MRYIFCGPGSHILLLQCVVCVYSAGTDEHGLKIQQAASKAGQEPLSFCTEVSQRFKHVFQRCSISYTDYIRTTEPRHRRAVEHFWTVLQSKGFLYKGTYEGWYSTPDESFLTPAQVTDSTDSEGRPIKVSAESGHKVPSIPPLIAPIDVYRRSIRPLQARRRSRHLGSHSPYCTPFCAWLCYLSNIQGLLWWMTSSLLLQYGGRLTYSGP